MSLRILVKKNNESISELKRGSIQSAGYDICSNECDSTLMPSEIKVFCTGISIEMPVGTEAQVRSRSGLATKGIIVLNSPGTIDSDYRGEIKVILMNVGKNSFTVKRNDRIAQIVFNLLPKIEIQYIESLSLTERGDKGLGSTD